MTKKRTLTLFFSFILATICAFSLIACGETKYSLYSYEYYGTNYEVGDTFYGVEIKEDLVVLNLKGENLELKISKAFLLGQPSLADEYVTYTGTYTETDSSINAIIPELSSGTISITKAGNLFSLKLSSSSTIILKK